MTNSRAKGKRGELYFLNEYVKPLWPKATTNRANQSAEKGHPDIVNIPFVCEVKIGRSYKSKMIRNIIDQLTLEAANDNVQVAFVKPDREDEYMLIPKASISKVLEIIKDA